MGVPQTVVEKNDQVRLEPQRLLEGRSRLFLRRSRWWLRQKEVPGNDGRGFDVGHRQDPLDFQDVRDGDLDRLEGADLSVRRLGWAQWDTFESGGVFHCVYRRPLGRCLIITFRIVIETKYLTHPLFQNFTAKVFLSTN